MPTRRRGFDFLGYHFERGYEMAASEEPGEAQRHDPGEDASAPTGRALQVIIDDVNRTLRGWFGYFKHSHRNDVSARWTAGFACGCAASCASASGGKDADAERTINAGRTLTLPSKGCSP